MALSKAKQQLANQFAAVLETLDDKNVLDQNILKATFNLLKALVEASAGQGDDMEAAAEDDTEVETEGDDTEVETGDDDVSFEDDGETSEDDGEIDLDSEESDDAEVEAGDDDEVSFEDDEEATADDDEVSFEDDEPAPAKPSRKPAAAAPVEEEAVDYDGMKAQDLYNYLTAAIPTGRSVDATYAKKIATTQKKDGLVKLAKNLDKLQAVWLKTPQFKKPVEVIEKLVIKMGVAKPSYGRGKSSDDKKRRILANALAGAMKKPS